MKPNPFKTNILHNSSFAQLGFVEMVRDRLPKIGINPQFPTISQKKILSVLNSKYSVLSTIPHGSGVSMAFFLHGLNLRHHKVANSRLFVDRGAVKVSSLVLAPTSQAVIQQKNWFNTMYDGYKLPFEVSFLYRGENEAQQLHSLIENRHKCHMVVTTAVRLLDILSEVDSSTLPNLSSLLYIGVDDADDQLRSVPGHVSPTTMLLDHLVGTNDELDFLQFAFGSQTSGDVKSVLEEKKDVWFGTASRKSNKVVSIGSPEIDSYQVVPQRTVPKFVDISCVVIENGIIKHAELPTASEDPQKHWEELCSNEVRAFDEDFRKYRTSVRYSEQQIGTVARSLKTYLDAAGCDASLVVVPDSMSFKKFENVWKEVGKNYNVTLRQFNQVKGITFHDLDTIIGLGIDTVRTPSQLETLASRVRFKGLLDPLTEFAYLKKGNPGKKKVVILGTEDDFGTREKLAMYRSLARCGINKI